MVKFKLADFNNAKKNKFSEFDAILFYGQDRGQVLENFNIAMETIAPEIDDGFSVFEFSSSDIKRDPSKLIDEATAISFLGTRKVIKIKDANEDVVEPLKLLLKNYQKLEAFIILSADELSPSSKLRSLFETNKRLAVLPNYIDTDENLSFIIKDTLAKAGKIVQLHEWNLKNFRCFYTLKPKYPLMMLRNVLWTLLVSLYKICLWLLLMEIIKNYSVYYQGFYQKETTLLTY